jgi:hypothetical protein
MIDPLTEAACIDFPLCHLGWQEVNMTSISRFDGGLNTTSMPALSIPPHTAADHDRVWWLDSKHNMAGFPWSHQHWKGQCSN